MMTSFAATTDWPVHRIGQPFARTSAKKTAHKLARRFAAVNENPARAAKKTTEADGMLGSILLDTLFGAAFPGLSLVFNGQHLGMLDAADHLDTYRDVRGPKPKQGRTPMTMITPVTPPRRPRSLLALLFS